MEPIEVSGKKIGDALKEGLRILGTTIDKVEYKVISTGGLFKKAKISISLLEDETAHKKPLQEKPVFNSEKIKETPFVQSNKHQTTDGETKQGGFQQKREQSQQPKNQKKYPEKKEQGFQKKDGTKPENKQNRPNRPTENKNNQPKAANAEESQKNYETKKRVRVQAIGEDDVKRVVDFTTELISRMGFEAQIKSSIVDGDIVVDIINDSGALIGYRGETLDAIEYLVCIHANKDADEYINVVIDSCGYRKKREKMLISMAENAANRCIKMGRKVVMEPMNRSSRKIVHSALAKYDNIFTKSEGSEPNRHIILFFKREKNN